MQAIVSTADHKGWTLVVLLLACTLLTGCPRSKTRAHASPEAHSVAAADAQRAARPRLASEAHLPDVDPQLAQLGHDPRWSPDPGDRAYVPLVGWPEPGPWPGPGAAVVSTYAGSVIGRPSGDTRETVRFRGLGGLAFGPSGDLYVVDDGSILRITRAGRVERVKTGMEGALGFNAFDLTFDHAGSMYVSDYYAGVYKVTPDGATTLVMAGKGAADRLGRALEVTRAWGLAIDAADNLYVADNEGNAVRKRSPRGDVSTFLSGIEAPEDLAFDLDGNLLVWDEARSAVLRVSPAGLATPLVSFLKRNLGCTGLLAHPDGHVYMTGGNALYRIAPDGTPRILSASNEGRTYFEGPDLAHTRFLSPRWMAIDERGDLYFTDSNGNTDGTPCAVRKVSFAR